MKKEQEKTYQNIKVENLPDSKVKITGEISVEAFELARKIALEHVRMSAELPGFRPGKAPEAMVVKHYGGMKILEQAAESAINEAYGPILDEHNIRAIGMPHVSITKIAPGNPLGFSIESAVMPEIKLENYKAMSQEAVAKIPDAATTVEEKEIDAVIDDLRKRMAASEPEGLDKESEKVEAKLPEVNEDFIKMFGNFPTVEAFRNKTKEQLLDHKKYEVKEKRRAAIADKLIAESKFEVPSMIVDSELDTMIGQFRADVERNGLKFTDYLSSLKKTEDDIRKEWRENALRRAQLELILKHIARAEKIKPAEEDIKKEVDNIVAHHKTADRFSVRMYVENLMTNKKVLEFLES